jgi:hypothetical protein
MDVLQRLQDRLHAQSPLRVPCHSLRAGSRCERTNGVVRRSQASTWRADRRCDGHGPGEQHGGGRTQARNECARASIGDRGAEVERRVRPDGRLGRGVRRDEVLGGEVAPVTMEGAWESPMATAPIAKPGTLVANAVPQVSAPIAAATTITRAPRPLRHETWPYTRPPSALPIDSAASNQPEAAR